jgi:SNF2 family DNA or RNA helicase
MLGRMAQIETSNRGPYNVGVMKDPAGSGKSYAVLALILAEKRATGRTQNLLVIPHNIVQQWVNYIANFSKELTWYPFVQYGDITRLYQQKEILTKYDILITTSTYYMVIAQTMQHIGAQFNRVLLDEIDSISWFTQTTIPSKFIWLISASSGLTDTGVFKSVIQSGVNNVQCSEKFIEKSIKLPPIVDKTFKCYNAQRALLNQLNVDREAIAALDFSRFKFDYIQNVCICNSKDLLSTIVRDKMLAVESLDYQIERVEKENEVPAILQFEQSLVNLADPENRDTKEKRPDQIVREKQAILKHLDRLKGDKKNAASLRRRQELMDDRQQIQAKIDMVLERVSEESCPVCLEDFSETVKKLIVKCCQNVFCLDCTKEQLRRNNSKCAKCRQILTEDMLVMVSSTAVEKVEEEVEEEEEEPAEEEIKEDSLNNPSEDKLDNFERIIKFECRDPSHRVLVFSDYDGTFTGVRKILEKYKIPFGEIEGTVESMLETIRAFKQGRIRVLLIDSLHYGAGLNLETTTSVVIMHQTPRKHQIIGRAQRIGRKAPLTVYNLLYDDERGS